MTESSRRSLLAVATLGAGALLNACRDGGSGSPSSSTERTGSTEPSPAVAATGASGPGELNPATPFITPTDRFYRIDNAIDVPVTTRAKWAVHVEGLVDRPATITYDSLLSRPPVERTVTLACVSNEVGGHLVGNAVWGGVLLADVLRECGIQAGAEQVFCTGLDGFTCGFPVAAATDGRDALIALTMNGKPLTREHGFPARLVVPGLYGYVSAAKWLRSIKLTTWDADQGYWIPLGWSRDAPIKAQCRIDVPRSGENVPVGTGYIAGVAWAPLAGVGKVEVSIDNGPWLEAELSDTDINSAWRQWRLRWQATAGSHMVRARTTDKHGVTQTETPSAPEPDGATGYPTRGFRAG